MQTGILITNGGPHSVDDWAYTSAAMLLEAIKVDKNSPRRSALEMAKDRIRPQLADVFRVHHDNVQRLEREKLAAGQHERLLVDLDAAEHTDVDQCVADAVALLHRLLDNSQLFKTESGEISDDHQHVIDFVTLVTRQRIERDLRTSMHIERSWHADRNPNHEHSKTFRAMSTAAPSVGG